LIDRPEDKRGLFDRIYNTMIAIAWQESKFNNRAVGTHGELGMFQIKPDTAREISQDYRLGYRDIRKALFSIKDSSRIAAFLIIDYFNAVEDIHEMLRMYNQGKWFRKPGYMKKHRLLRAELYVSEVKKKVALVNTYTAVQHEKGDTDSWEHWFWKNNFSSESDRKGTLAAKQVYIY